MNLSLDTLLARATAADASDLHLQVGCKPWIRIQGALRQLQELPVVDAQGLRALALERVEPLAWELFEAGEHLATALLDGEGTPWRATFVHHEGKWALALRRLAKEIPGLKQLHLPEEIERLAHFRDGLLLFTGPSGSGKSTTMAAVVNQIHQRNRRHIITLEQPVEYRFGDGLSVMEQRDVGEDVLDVEQGIHEARRAGAGVVVIGELHSANEAEAALAAAESGILVLASLHAGSAIGAIDRLIHLFPAARSRAMVEQTLRSVVWQTLIPARTTGRVPACEILFNTPAIGALIRDGRCPDISHHLQTGQRYGMQSLDRALRRLVVAGRIEASQEEAWARE